MENFQKTVIIISVCILIICLIFIGISLYKGKYNRAYPPVVASCPDYWDDESETKIGAKCVNKKHLGNTQCEKTMDFSGSIWNACAKAKWANSCDLSWDGVDNVAEMCKPA